MERPLLNDKNEYPDEEVLTRHLRRAKSLWDDFWTRLDSVVPGASHEWRFYDDGKAWLCKLTRQKKTLCWISVWDGFFKTSFHFSAAKVGDLDGLPISPKLKESYRAGDPVGKLKSLAVDLRSRRALEDALTLVKYKSESK